MVSNAFSFTLPGDGITLKGCPALTPRVWARIAVPPSAFTVAMISVILPLVG